MRLHALATSVLLACAEAQLEEYHKRDLAPRAYIAVGPSGVCPVQPDVTVILQPVYNGTSISYVTQTQTVTAGGASTTSPASVSVYTPPFSLGQGVPSGYITDLPFASFFFLGYSTPGAAASVAPVAKRDNLERRQQPVQTTASPIKLVDVSVPTPSLPALGANVCDDATPLDLVQGVLNGKGFSVGKLPLATNVILGALINAPDNQVNLTFAISNGLLQWNAPDVGGASFYSCGNMVYAGFPNLNIAGCTQVNVGPVAGQVCISYVTSTRSVNPDFVAPLTATSTSAVSSATATGSGSGNPSASGSGSGNPSASGSGSGNPSASGSGSGNPSASGSGSGNPSASGSGAGNPSASGSGSGNPSASGSGSGNPSASGSGSGNPSASGSGSGNPSASGSGSGSGSGSTTSTGSRSSLSTTSTSSSTTATGSITPQNCLIALPDDCLTLQTGVLTGLGQCTTNLLPQLDVSGAGRALQCLTRLTGLEIFNCLNTAVLCSSATRSASASSASASGSSCLATINTQPCNSLGTTNGLAVVGAALACVGSLPTLDVSGTAAAAVCITQSITSGLGAQGLNTLNCLTTGLVCPSSTTSSRSLSSTSSAPATSSSGTALLACLARANLPGPCNSLAGVTLTNAFGIVTDPSPVFACSAALAQQLLTLNVPGAIAALACVPLVGTVLTNPSGDFYLNCLLNNPAIVCP